MLVEVAHIESKVGPQGGAYWWLTLACGHHKAVRQVVFDPTRFVGVAHRGNVRQQRQARRRANLNTYLAPKRVKCLVCEPREDE